MSRGTILVTTVAATVVLTLTGCGAAEPEVPEVLPLEAFSAAVHGRDDPAAADAELIRREELVAECMAAEGFDYTPAPYTSEYQNVVTARDFEEETGIAWGSREFVERYGYGHATRPVEDLAPREAPPAFEDPNPRYEFTMSPEERLAYNRTRYGERWPDEPEVDEEAWPWEERGCEGHADHAVYGHRSGWSGSSWEGLWRDIGGMYDAVLQDPRVTAAVQDWSDCMADRGHPGMTHLRAADDLAHERASAVIDEVYASTTVADPEEHEATVERGLRAGLDPLVPDEIALALADLECREASRHDEIERRVRYEYELELLETHRAELERYLLETGVDADLGNG